MKSSCTCHSHNGFRLSSAELEQRGVDRAHELAMLALDNPESQLYLDRVGSVSGLGRDEDLYADVSDALLNEQYRRFHNGC